MDRLSKRMICAALLFTLLICAVGCSFSQTTPQSVLAEIQNAEGAFPAGKTYFLNTPKESESYLSDTLFSALFGNGKLPPERALLADGAVYCGISSPCEYVVFLCKNRDDCEAVSQMCMKRLDALKNFWQGNEEYAYVQNGSVTVRGRWVFLCVSPTSENAVRAFRRAV